MVTLKNIQEARSRIKNEIRTTPLLLSRDSSTWLKCENMQLTGAFKERGALNKLRWIQEKEKIKKVIAASAGNHAQAVSYHGTRLKFEVNIVMPEYTATNKVLSTQRWGGKVQLFGASFDAAIEHAQSQANKIGRASCR